MRTWTSWLLAGALAASLQWNLRGGAAATPPPPTSDAPCGPSDACPLDPAAVGLSPDQVERASAACRTSCRTIESLESELGRARDELRRKLADPRFGRDELDRLVSSICDLRRRSLEACVDSALELRGLLEPNQLAALLDCPPN